PGNTTTGLLENTLINVGTATDNLLPLNLAETAGGLGKVLDPTVGPVVDVVTGLTQTAGAATGLGQPVDGLTTELGQTVVGLGDKVSSTGSPLGQGVGGLVTGLGNAVGSAGGLLNADSDNSQPLTTVLAHATGGVIALTEALGGQNGLLSPITQPLGLGG